VENAVASATSGAKRRMKVGAGIALETSSVGEAACVEDCGVQLKNSTLLKYSKYFNSAGSYTGSILGECAWTLRESKGGRLEYMSEKEKMGSGRNI
jgi:hypothetical protein